MANIASFVEGLIRPTVEEKGCSLWDVEFVKEGALYILRITIDKVGGVDITDCEAVHRAIDPILDEADPIEGAYTLEVSSPGVERVLRTPAHVIACLGQVVTVKLFTAIDGAKQLLGVLAEYNETQNSVLIARSEEDGIWLALNQISRMQLYYDFEHEGTN